MEKKLQPIVNKLEKEFNAAISEQHGDVSLTIHPDKLVDAILQVKKLGFELLSAMTAVDYWPAENPRFHVLYQFTSLAKNLRLGLRVPLSGIQPSLPTVSATPTGASANCGTCSASILKSTPTCAAS